MEEDEEEVKEVDKIKEEIIEEWSDEENIPKEEAKKEYEKMQRYNWRDLQEILNTEVSFSDRKQRAAVRAFIYHLQVREVIGEEEERTCDLCGEPPEEGEELKELHEMSEGGITVKACKTCYEEAKEGLEVGKGKVRNVEKSDVDVLREKIMSAEKDFIDISFAGYGGFWGYPLEIQKLSKNILRIDLLQGENYTRPLKFARNERIINLQYIHYVTIGTDELTIEKYREEAKRLEEE